MDADGAVDIVVLNSRRPASVLRNTSPSVSNWVELELVGSECNRSAVGSRVTVVSEGKRQTLEVHSGRGYQSHFGSRLHFGIGAAKNIDQIEVIWHGHETQLFRDIPCNGIYLLREGSDEVRLALPIMH